MSGAIRSEVLNSRYIFEHQLGLWTFGTTQVLKERNTGDLKTCKLVRKAMLQHPQGVGQKLARLQGFRCPHICPISEVLEDEHYFFVISNRCNGEDLDAWMDRVDALHWVHEATAAAYIAQALVALAHCHAACIFHCDLRPSNVLLTSKMPDATVMLSDFGIAPVLDPDKTMALRHSSGPNPYLAPELLSPSRSKSGEGAADIWSIGAIAHLLLAGQPLKEEGGGGLVNLSGTLAESAWSDRSAVSRDFVRRLLLPAAERPSAAMMLQHPWLKTVILPRGIGGRATQEDAQKKLLCYMLAVLLAPALILPQEFQALRTSFARRDADRDGFMLREAASNLLENHRFKVGASRKISCSTEDLASSEELAAALEIVDVRGTGVFDLCSTACAALAARKLHAMRAAGVPASTADELERYLVAALAEVYGAGGDSVAVVSLPHMRQRLCSEMAVEIETYCGVSYDEILSCFPDTFPKEEELDGHAISSMLTAGAGRGTPLAYGPRSRSSGGCSGHHCCAMSVFASGDRHTDACKEDSEGRFQDNVTYLEEAVDCCGVSAQPSPRACDAWGLFVKAMGPMGALCGVPTAGSLPKAGKFGIPGLSLECREYISSVI
mmetsp:Transcript_1378/g.3030  ORF Transcript_1378/g.3030 Transcript_1378/m.3030 type:complete len:609 (-) Transcript_1378:146-1972(-)